MDVDRDVVAALKTHEDGLRGIEVVPVPVRYYPYGELGAHLIGYMREIDPDTLARFEGRGYRAGDQLGRDRRRAALGELSPRAARAGARCCGASTSAPRARIWSRSTSRSRAGIEPVPGRDVSLTVDIELEKCIENAMRGQLAGAVVVVDVRTGRFWLRISKPSFDPNVVSGGSGMSAVREAFRRLYSDPLKPTLDKTISAAYPPGSTYKPFSALAALADRLIDPATCRSTAAAATSTASASSAAPAYTDT